MKKSTKFLLFVYLFINFSLYAYKISDKVDYEIEVVGNLDNTAYSVENTFTYNILKNPNTQYPLSRIAASPPTVTSPIYLCQNSPAFPLTATPSTGGTLNWYGTNATGGTASSTAPTPSTTTVGTTSYYVSETVSGVESTRSKIDVIVVADNGATILGFRCDPSQIPIYSLDYSPPATINNSVLFDWSNNPPLIPDNSYNYSYSIEGGPIVKGNTGVSHYLVPNMLPGQSATLTLTAATRPCAPALTLTCTVPCGTSTVTPNFPAIAPFCSGTTAPILGTTSPNGITGTWSPPIISNTTNGSYVFTPNPILFPCATTQTLAVTVTPLVTPTFTTIPTSVCQNATAPVLPLNSSNATPISGTWSPAAVDMTVLGPVTYTFTPNSGQCTSATPTTASITIVPVVTPNFANISPFCSGTTAPLLSNTSPNGIVGTWSPSIISNTTSRSYLFTPNANQCAATQTLNVTVTAKSVPNFAAIPAFCSGTTAPTLATISPNGINGTWSPATISNTASGSYVFTPNTTECATTQTLAVTVTPSVTPTFATIPTTVCQNATAPVLPLNSSNATPISGTWSPASVDMTVLGPVTYTFTPNSGQCTSATPTTASITIVPVVTPNFANISPFCSGTTAPLLPNTSPNGIVGTWSPSIISNTTSRSYLFTPNANQCATTQTLNVTVTAKSVPNFAAIPAFCSGTTAPTLVTISPNGINGTWSPATISNTVSGSYVFTPNATECATTQTLAVIINPLIVPNFNDLSICSGSVAPILNNTSPNGIAGVWSPSIIDNTTSGTYEFTPNPNQCASTKTINVTVSPSNTLVSVDWTVSEAFAKNQVVTITATAPGDYLYQLDDGPFQESPVFEYVSLGTHSITVVDKNGCSAPITRTNVLVINYPKFFTPNNDGSNDTWNIFSLEDQSNFRILIFDRYGKFLKEIKPKSVGWDGMYNGHPMPSNDYWFSVEYAEQNIPKIFKSHFSLKR